MLEAYDFCAQIEIDVVAVLRSLHHYLADNYESNYWVQSTYSRDKQLITFYSSKQVNAI